MATHQRCALLPEVLAPLLADPAAEEIIVVVDGCRDGSLELLDAMSEHESRLKPVFVDNGGAARARLTGAQLAAGEVLVILDDDEIVRAGTVGGHARHHRDRTDLVVEGYVEMNLPAKRRPGDFARYIYAKQYERDCQRAEREPGEVLLNLWGGYISIRRENYLAAMAGVDHFVEGYHWDLDFGARCVALGLHGVFDRSLYALHLYERDRPGFLKDARSSGRNRIRIHNAHPDVLPRIDHSFIEQGYPFMRRWLLRAAVRFPALRKAVGTAATLSGQLHLWPFESAAAGLLWGIEARQGAIEAAGGH